MAAEWSIFDLFAGRSHGKEDVKPMINVPISLTKTRLWGRAGRAIRLAGGGIAKRMHPAPSVDQGGLVRPRHYPPRNCAYLDDELLSREMYCHVRDEPIRLSSRLAFRLRRS